MQDWRTIPVQEHFNDILKSLLGKQSRVKLLDTTPATDPVWYQQYIINCKNQYHFPSLKHNKMKGIFLI